MKRYNVKCLQGNTEYIDVLKEEEEGFLVRFTRIRDGSVRTSEETISKNLFNICLQTGYLNPISESAAA